MIHEARLSYTTDLHHLNLDTTDPPTASTTRAPPRKLGNDGLIRGGKTRGKESGWAPKPNKRVVQLCTQ